MDQSYLEIANSFGMWVACSFIVIVVIVQAIIFMKKAWATGQELGLEKKQMTSALRSRCV